MIKNFIKIITIFLIFIFSCSEKLNFQFAWLSDTHIGATTSVPDLRQAVRDLNSLDYIDFTIISGDVTEMGSNEELELAKTILDSLKKPYYIIPGNHDTKWSESGCTKFPELWGTDKFVFEFKGIHFIGMHQGPIMRMGDGFFAPEDIRWFDYQLSKISNNQPLIFITHYPLNSSISNWYEILDRLKKYNTVAVLFGHGHRNKVWDFETLPGVMGRSTLFRKKNSRGYNIVNIKSDSIIFSERITGEISKSPWHRLTLNPGNYLADTTKYERPNFSINNKFPNIKIEWSFETFNTIASAPAVWENYVVAGNSAGEFYCLSLNNGQELWKFKSENSIYSSPVISNDKVVFGSTDKHIYCLNIKNGRLIWKYKTRMPVVAAPNIYQGVIYIGSSEGKFRAIDLETGTLVWQYEGIKEFVETKPLIYQNKIIFGAWDSYLYALNILTGQLEWKWCNGKSWKLISPAACLPVAAENKIFIVAPDRYMTAIDVNNGETVWRTPRYKVRETIGISEDGKTVFAKCMSDTLLAFSTRFSKPNLVWMKVYKFGYDINPSMLIEKNGTLFFATQRGFVYAVNPKSGKLKWKFRCGVALINTVAPIDSNQVVVTDMDGRVMLVKRH